MTPTEQGAGAGARRVIAPTLVATPDGGAEIDLGVVMQIRFVLWRAAVAGIAVLPLAAMAQVTPFVDRTAFAAAAPDATIAIDFERGLAPGTGTGSLATFGEAGFVSFVAGSNYTQQVADGFNLGQGDNDVYVSQAIDKAAPTADIRFGAGVTALGFDFKNTASGGGTASLVPQSFTFNLFADGGGSLGSFSASTLVGGTMFSFLGFTSTVPIAAMTIVAAVPGASPNLDIVLDNFAVAAPVSEPAPLALMLAGLATLGVMTRRRRVVVPS